MERRVVMGLAWRLGKYWSQEKAPAGEAAQTSMHSLTNVKWW